MSYLNDQRENAIREESGITLEADNRIEPMYHWGAMVLDLCGMDPEEYMKNPIVEAINGGGSGGGGGSDTGSTGGNDDIIEAINSATESINENITASTQQVVDAISSSTEDIVEAISSSTENMLDANSSSTETIVDAIDSAATTISEMVYSSSSSEVVFYYASVNNGESVSSADFTETYAIPGSNTNITFKLGNPSADDWSAYKDGTINESELRRRSANTFYLAVPSEFDGKFSILENGSVDITDKFVHSESIFTDYTTYQSADEDYFNDDYSDINTRIVGVAYKIIFNK